MASFLSIRLRGGLVSAFLLFAWVLVAISLLVGCTPPRSAYREIHVCARPPVIPRGVATWVVSDAGSILWNAREVSDARSEARPVYVLDPDAPEERVKLLPIPYNTLKCPRRLAPPKPAAPKTTVVARKVEAKKEAAPKEVKKTAAAVTRTKVVVRCTSLGRCGEGGARPRRP